MFSLNMKIKSKIATHNKQYAPTQTIQNGWSALSVLQMAALPNRDLIRKASIIIENPLRIFASSSTNNNKEA